uniref:Sigma non-opioid intracellular receptor 1 n=1 Tax=Caenorhabditis japonica TaxID=281687 RepID=A0A8R1DUW8_CAEJA
MALVGSKLRYLLVIYAAFSAIQYGLRYKSYDVSPKQFKTVAGKAAASPTSKQALSTLLVGMRSHYEPILPRSVEWHAIQLGSLSIRIFPIYTAFTEYAAAFSAPFATSGRAGLHWANSTCTVLSGQVGRISDDTQGDAKETFTQGNNFRHGQFESYVYQLEKDTLVACYGRGFLPLSSTAHITAGISAGEPLSVVRFYLAQAGNYYTQIAQSVQRVFQHYKARASGEL